MITLFGLWNINECLVSLIYILHMSICDLYMHLYVFTENSFDV